MAYISIIKTQQQQQQHNKIFQILDFKRPPSYFYLSIWFPSLHSSSFLSLLPPPPTPFSLSLLGRRNSDSENEDSGSFQSSTIFSRLEKADHRLDSSYQRPSLLLELATKHAMRSRDTHAARRTSSALQESRCTCLHELPACGWPDTFSDCFCCYFNLDPEYRVMGT